ncbi:hypothetical protein ACIO6U_15585 [Streptomyces sp. NPDC087422]|uniref:hypothetical protein n=1 Tax=Streptomyces sp. NPDC087422 TaxID=3365786 RepID=UPI0037FD838D
MLGPKSQWVSAPVAPIGAASGEDAPAPGWVLHVGVDEVAAVGGSVLLPPSPDSTGAVTALVADSAGTRFSLREAGDAAEPGRSDQPSTFAWAELITDDAQVSAAFYSSVLVWTLTASEGPLGRRARQIDGVSVCGLLPRPAAMASPYLVRTQQTAKRKSPVSDFWLKRLFKGLPATADSLRQDRALEEATAAGPDPLRIATMFNLSAQASLRYTYAAGPSDTETTIG